MEHHYTAITLGKRDIGETDRLYTLYTREAGKIKAYARGVRKSGARLVASLEDLSLLSTIVMRSRGTGNIKSAIVERSYIMPIKDDLGVLQRAVEGARVFDRLVGMEEPDPIMFDLFVSYLERLSGSEHVCVGFWIQVLSHLGHTLQVRNCILCGEKVKEEQLLIDVDAGGVLCERCRDRARYPQSFSLNAVKFYHIASQNSLSLIEKVKISDRDLRMVANVVKLHIDSLLN